MTFEAGQLPHPGKHHVDTLPVAAGTVTKGNFTKTNAGNAENMVDTDTTIDGVYVALETAVFANGDTEVQVAGPGSEVIVNLGGAIQPGGLVKLDANSKVVAATGADLEAEKVVGRYLRHPGETTATPGADNELGIVKLGAV